MNTKKQRIIIRKLDVDHQETWRYEGQILRIEPDCLLIEALFNRDDLQFHGITLKRNDPFIERYYQDRWYNIFEMHDREDGHLKGWYCNVSKPAEFNPGEITYVDLALDLLVYPDMRYLILDEDEFRCLNIDETSRSKAREALEELISLVKTGKLKDLFLK